MAQRRKTQQRRRAARKQAAARRQAEEQRRAASVRTASVRDAEGRTHLVVHRDAQGAVRRLSLSRPLFEAAWQNHVAVAAAATAHGLLAERRTRDQAVALAKKAMAATSELVAALFAQAGDAGPACRSGCSHCCYQAVGVSAPEVFAIYEHLRATRGPEELEAVTERVRAADDRTRGMPFEARLSPELPCPLLEDERCSVYEVRPLACRGKNSLDAAACERSLRDPDVRAEHLAGGFAVPCFVEPVRAFHSVAAGLQLALHELHGLEVRPLELTAALRLLGDDPESIPEAWLRGEDALAAARGGDTTHDPHIAALGGRHGG